jgi:predicted DNA-binding transcriptional regulator YafY
VRASRLLSLILLLQNRGRMTARELAAELEVSVRTVYRDAEALAQAGIPLYGDAGPNGGYQLVGGYRTKLTGLLAGEAESLALAGLPQAASQLGLGSLLSAAQSKLSAALPAELRGRTARVAERFLLDPHTWYRAGEDEVPLLPAVAAAVWEQRRIAVRYRRWAAPQEVERVLDPYGLVLKSGAWYTVAAHQGRALTYRVSQLIEVRQTREGFERPTGFDLAEHWRTYLRDFDARRLRIRILISLRPELLEPFAGQLDSAAGERLLGSASGPDERGLVGAELWLERLEQAVPLLLAHGTGIEVLDPVELRVTLGRTAASVAAMYRT